MNVKELREYLDELEQGWITVGEEEVEEELTKEASESTKYEFNGYNYMGIGCKYEST